MRLPFKLPSNASILRYFFSKLVQKFGPLFSQQDNQELIDRIDVLSSLVANLAEMSGGPGWVDSTQAAIIDLAKNVESLREAMLHHQKILEEIKRTEDLWRGGRALNKLS